ncbi:MAG: cell division protein FtsA [Campylobacterales bacterium]|nr:cell division protein FtsA [Campylobacterales bacterium]
MAQILAVDIGSTVITTIAAQFNNSKLTLTGAGIAASRGLKKGSVVNISDAANSIKQSVEDAKRQAGVSLGRAIISISGAHVKSVDSFGIVNIPTKEITEKEVNRAMRTAVYNASISTDYEVLHALPYNFTIDGQEGIQDPVGMSGSRLEASVHIVMIQKSTLENLKRTVGLAGIEIENVVLTGYASAIAAVDESEKDLGVCVIDMGGATCNMVVHQGNAIRYNEFLGVGGSNITGDLTQALHTPIEAAEAVKKERGSLTKIHEGTIELPLMGSESDTQEASLEVVSNVIYARVEETLMILSKQLEKSGHRHLLGAGIILTGGMTKLEGMREMASPLFDNMPVRIARPKDIEGLFEALKDPSYSTAFGLIRYGAGGHTLYEIDSNSNLRTRSKSKEEHSQPEAPNLDALSLDIESQLETKTESLADVKLEKSKENEDSGIKGVAQKLWNSATQLF